MSRKMAKKVCKATQSHVLDANHIMSYLRLNSSCHVSKVIIYTQAHVKTIRKLTGGLLLVLTWWHLLPCPPEDANALTSLHVGGSSCAC